MSPLPEGHTYTIAASTIPSPILVRVPNCQLFCRELPSLLSRPGWRHTGARRIAPIRLGTLTFYERGLSSGAMSLGSLLESQALGVITDRISVTEAVDAIVIGGWPTNVGLSTSQALEANIDYIDMIVNADVRRVDGVRRDPDGVRRVIAS